MNFITLQNTYFVQHFYVDYFKQISKQMVLNSGYCIFASLGENSRFRLLSAKRTKFIFGLPSRRLGPSFGISHDQSIIPQLQNNFVLKQKIPILSGIQLHHVALPFKQDAQGQHRSSRSTPCTTQASFAPPSPKQHELNRPLLQSICIPNSQPNRQQQQPSNPLAPLATSIFFSPPCRFKSSRVMPQLVSSI